MVKQLLFAAGLSLLLVTVSLPVHAQSIARPVVLKGNIPFEFFYGDKLMPAGQYSVSIQRAGVTFIDANGHPIHFRVSNPQQETTNQEKPRLVFNQYGPQRFLAQIWTSSHSIDFRSSSTETTMIASYKKANGSPTVAMR